MKSHADAPTTASSLSRPGPSRRVWRVTRWFVIRAVRTYVLLLIIFWGISLTGCADKLLLFPTTDRIDVSNAAPRQVETPTGAVQVWVAQTNLQAEPQAFVLGFIGNASRAEYELQRTLSLWAEHPVEIWMVNYPGFGGSAGSAKVANIPAAALAAYDDLAKQANGRRVFVDGLSIGTAAALYVAANRPVAGVVLHNPPPLRQLILGRFGWWNLWLAATFVARAVPPELDSLSNGARCTAPAVFLLAAKDSLVTPPYQRRVADAYAGPKHFLLLSDADHNDPIEGPLLSPARAEIDWLWKP